MGDTQTKKYAPILWFLLGLFCLRVLGQLLVAIFQVPFLPPMEEWHSEVLSYPVLVGFQVIIIVILVRISLNFTKRRVIPRRTLGLRLLGIGSLYFTVMVVRYTIRMSLYPDERWFGGSMPIFFHWVLATFLLVVGFYHWRNSEKQITDRSQLSSIYIWKKRILKGTIYLTILIVLLAWITYQLLPSLLAYHLRIRPPEYFVKVDKSVAFTTQDGIKLVSDIYRPQRVEKTATILIRIPYTKNIQARFFSNVIGRLWAERGYTVVIQGTRGRYESEGRHVPFQKEREDGIATLNWIANQPWYNGKIGTWGASYFGYTQWVIADQVNPGLSALFVQIASTNFYEMFYPGGAFSFESALFWAARSYTDKDTPHSLEQLKEGYKELPLIEADNRTVGDVDFYNDWATHTQKDEFWRKVDGQNRTSTLKAPVLLLAGWFDPFLPTQLNDYQSIKSEAPSKVADETKLIIGPWAHARSAILPGGFVPRNYRLESLTPSLDWFDIHLKNRPIIKEIAPVRIFIMGINEWRNEMEWPLARTKYTSVYLNSHGQANTQNGNGSLTLDLPTHGAYSDTFIYNPQNPVPSLGGTMLGPRAGTVIQNTVEDREDVLVYTGPILEEDIEVTGNIKVILYISTTSTNTDFTVKLVDVHTNGNAYNVSEGILRQDYKPSDFPVKIEIDLWPTSIVFFKGHRIRLEISSSNYPRFDRNQNTGRKIYQETKTVTAIQKVYHGPESPSELILPIIPK